MTLAIRVGNPSSPTEKYNLLSLQTSANLSETLFFSQKLTSSLFASSNLTWWTTIAIFLFFPSFFIRVNLINFNRNGRQGYPRDRKEQIKTFVIFEYLRVSRRMLKKIPQRRQRAHRGHKEI